MLYTQRVTSLVDLLTVHYHPHILDKTVDYLECLRGGQFSFVLRESVQSLKNRLNILLPEQLLDKFLCITLSLAIYY